MTKMVEAKLNGKYKLILPEHRANRPEWYTKEGWERARIDRLVDAVLKKKHAIVYYVGAEEGDIPAILAKFGAHLVLFEPNPAVWPNIKAIWEANDLPPPVSFAAFAGNKSAGDPIHYRGFPASASGPVIADHGFKNLCEADGTIPIVKIDDLISIAPPDIITLDVEGAEWEVLRGAEETLRKHHPKIFLSLHPEFMYEIYKEYAFDLRRWIKDLGYTEELLDYKHEAHLLYEAKQ